MNNKKGWSITYIKIFNTFFCISFIACDQSSELQKFNKNEHIYNEMFRIFFKCTFQQFEACPKLMDLRRYKTRTREKYFSPSRDHLITSPHNLLRCNVNQYFIMIEFWRFYCICKIYIFVTELKKMLVFRLRFRIQITQLRFQFDNKNTKILIQK